MQNLQNGSLEVYSPILGEGNGQIPILQPNAVNVNSRKIRVGLGSTLAESLVIGNRFSQLTTQATGDFVGAAGSAIGDLTIVNAGIGYTPASGGITYTGVALTSITGTGQNITADISITDGVAVGATVNTQGTGYLVGDVQKYLVLVEHYHLEEMLDSLLPLLLALQN